jgi:glycosyltransferase involved in cell wall biosynthesis
MNVIALVSYPFLPARSGGQKGIALFYKYFSKYHSVTIVTTKINSPDYAQGYNLLNILSNSRLRYINPFIFFTLRRQISKYKASHLILEHPYYGWLGILLKKFCGVKLVVHSHNIEGKRWRSLGKWWWSILWRYERITHRVADYNFFIQDEDRAYAIKSFGLRPESCLTVSFGTELSQPVPADKRRESGENLRRELQIPEDTLLLIFNGAFKYSPNAEALENLLLQINPLLQKKNFSYLILVLGLDIPESIRKGSYPSVRILGFVDDLERYLQAGQVFLNPVISGGGIKTKLVEALAYGLQAVSSANGAIGIDQKICRDNLVICPDGDWVGFADAVFRIRNSNSETPPEFYDLFYWANITNRAAQFIIGNG